MFLGSNSSMGFYSLFEQIQSMELNRYFIIKGGPGTGKSIFMKKIGKHIEDMKYALEYYHCSSDCDSLDGVFIPELKIALVDGTAPHIVDPRYPGLIDEILDFTAFLVRDKLLPYKGDIIQIDKNISLYFKRAYLYLKQAAVVLEQHSLELNWKHEREIDIRQVTRKLIEEIFGNIEIKENIPKIRRFFASGITPQGICSYYSTLIAEDMKIYCLNEYIGLNAKEILSKITDTAYELGLDTEVYHCPFMPNAIDMVIIPLLNTAVVNTSYPYHSNTIEKNKYLDITEIKIHPYEGETEHFTSLIDMAIEDIKRAKLAHDTLEEIYAGAMDFEKVDEKYSNVLEIISRYR